MDPDPDWVFFWSTGSRSALYQNKLADQDPVKMGLDFGGMALRGIVILAKWQNFLNLYHCLNLA